MPDPIRLAQKPAQIRDHWQPGIVARYNNNDGMVVQVLGEFTWHAHPETDDVFHVLAGQLTIELRDGAVQLGPGDIHVVPAGVAHRPVAREEVHLLLIELFGTPNTGDPAMAAVKAAP